MDRKALEDTVLAYYADIDRFDLDATFARMADGVRLEVEPDNVTAAGKDAVRGVYQHILDGCQAMEHQVMAMATDVERRLVAVELVFRNTAKDGTTTALHDVTWIELDRAGLISRVAFWLGHDRLAAAG